MIEFYDRQARHSIKATPKDCQETMKQRGLDVLTEKQIKSWWSTYHSCFVDQLGNQFDAFGANCLQQVCNNFDQLATTGQSTYNILMAVDTSVALIFSSDGSGVIVDSHLHGNHGSLIAQTEPGKARELALWYMKMMEDTWNTPIKAVSIRTVSYKPF